LAAEAVNPSYLAIDRTGRHLYAVNESGRGQVIAYSVEPNLNLRELNAQGTHGDSPCHLSVAPGGKTVLVANYGSGNVTRFPINVDGSLDRSDGEFQNHGGGPNHDRQEGPHMHMIFGTQTGRFVYACDLGTDEVLAFPFSRATGAPSFANPRRNKANAGAGPRHAVMDAKGRYLYVNNEMQSSVSVFAVNDNAGELREIQTITSLPENYAGRTNTTAEIAIHPTGKWLYVSNRGHDSIAEYAVGAGGRLKLLDVFRLTIHEPRGFAIDPTGRWLVAGGQHSNNLASMEIDQKTGLLEAEKAVIHMPAPVCVLFAKN
jgi:6-phosphogluconolactonase